MWIRGRRWLIWMWDTGDRWDSYKLSPFILPSSERHHVDILYERKGICWWMSATATNSINDHQTYKLIFFLLITKIASINILNCNYVLISDVISSSLKKEMVSFHKVFNSRMLFVNEKSNNYSLRILLFIHCATDE